MERAMKKKLSMLALAAGFAIAALAGGVAAASALIEQAKAECVVGEQADGYLGVVDPRKADSEIRREVDSINMQRKAAYEKLATRNGVTIEAAAALTAEKLINQAPSGHCVRDQDGVWYKKP
jgi:uncharacterized protein YdbL (DUF1318 family)